MNGIDSNFYTKSLSGLSDIYADDIMTTNITATNIYTSTGTNILSTTNDLQNQINDIVIYDLSNTTTTNNLQTQINTILAYDMSSATTINNLQNQVNNITSTSSSGGGYFTVVCERLGHVANNTFGFGAGLYNNNEIVLPACTLKMSRITASQNVTSGTTYYVFYKNGAGTSISTGIYSGTSSNTVSHNLTFASGDTFKIVTLNSGSYTTNTTVQLRINLIFECVGIKGADGISPTLTIGTVSTLPSSSDATITNTGTSTNQIINYGIPRGERGYVGLTPILSIGTVVNLPQGSTSYVNFDATSTDTNKILNFGLVNGIVPTFSVGSVTVSSTTPSVSFDATSTDTNKILNFALVQGSPGQSIKGDKGDKGEPGSNGIDAGDIGNAIGTATVFIALQTQVTALQAQVTGLDATVTALGTTVGEIEEGMTTLYENAGDLKARVDTLEPEMNTVNNKLLKVVKTDDGTLQIQSKFQVTTYVQQNTPIPVEGGPPIIIPSDPVVVLASFDPDAKIITLGTTGSTNNMLGNTINMGSLSTVTSNINGTTINIGDVDSTGFQNVVSSDNINIQAKNIAIGTAGYLNNVYIGNSFSNVRIESMDSKAIIIDNFMTQF